MDAATILFISHPFKLSMLESRSDQIKVARLLRPPPFQITSSTENDDFFPGILSQNQRHIPCNHHTLGILEARTRLQCSSTPILRDSTCAAAPLSPTVGPQSEVSEIRRWTDGVRWSPSRTHGDFLIYRELDTASSRKVKAGRDLSSSGDNAGTGSISDEQYRGLDGLLITLYNFKSNGSVKKILNFVANVSKLHLVF